jgi:hypothetical protein
MPRKWIQKVMDELRVNPIIEVCYSDNPKEIDKPNCLHMDGDSLDGLATDDNEVFIYVGKWSRGKFKDWSSKYLKWVIAHELKHQFYNYHLGNFQDRWTKLNKKERRRREEISCSHFASRKVGIPNKDFKRYATRNNSTARNRV